MARAAYHFVVQDAAGNIVPDATVRVRSEATNALVPIYQDRNGATPYSNPQLFASGAGTFYVRGGAYRINITAPGGFATERRHVAIGTAAEYDVEQIIALAGEYAAGPLADRDDFDAQDAGFVYYVTDDPSGSIVIYVREGETPGTWSGPRAFGLAGSALMTGTALGSVEIGAGEKTFTIAEEGVRGWAPGSRLQIASAADPATHWLSGVVTAYEHPDLTVEVDTIAGTGARGDWSISLAGFKGDTGAAGIDGASQMIRVRVVDTGEGDPATDYEAGDTIDGVELTENDFILRATAGGDVADGIYQVPNSGAASRAAAFAAYDDMPGIFVSVMEGTANADTLWRCTSDRGGTVDSTALVFTEFRGGGLDDIAEEQVASASTADIGAAASPRVEITGTTTITSFGTAANKVRLLRFAGALTLTHHATSLILPTGANITTAAGDTAIAASDGSGNWRVTHYQRANGNPLNIGTSGATVPLLNGANTFSGATTLANDVTIRPASGTAVKLVRNGTANFEQETYSDTSTSAPTFFWRKAKGSESSPAALSSGDTLFAFLVAGRVTAGFTNVFRWNGIATEDYGSNAGAYMDYEITATGAGLGRVQVMRLGDGGKVFFPNAGTTASGANAFLDSGSSPANRLLRSTSRRDAKRDIEPADAEHVDAALALDPVYYRSALPADNPEWSWYGLIAEEVAEVDPRLVHYGYPDSAYDHKLVEERSEVPVLDDNGEPVTNEDGTPRTTEVVSGHRLVSTLKDGAEKVPMGVAYDRVLLLQVAALKRLVAAQAQAIEALAARVAAIEAGK